MFGIQNKNKSRWFLSCFGAVFLLAVSVSTGLFHGAGAAQAPEERSLPQKVLLGDEEGTGEPDEGSGQGQDQEFENVNLPDLQTLPPEDLQIDFEAGTEDKLLRFSNLVVNTGHGPLEMRGEFFPQSSRIRVWQHLIGSEDRVVKELDGAFYYSSEHNHYHWPNFARYEIWTVETNGTLSRQMVSRDKVGFCIFETEIVSQKWLEENVERELDIPSSPEYTQCGINRQGISVGWVDVYEYDLAGQTLNIEDLDDNVYALRSTVDPEGVLNEIDPDNNTAVIYFYLGGDEVHVIGEEFSLLDVFNLPILRSEPTPTPTPTSEKPEATESPLRTF